MVSWNSSGKGVRRAVVNGRKLTKLMERSLGKQDNQQAIGRIVATVIASLGICQLGVTLISISISIIVQFHLTLPIAF